MNGSRLRKAMAAGAISALVFSGAALAQSEEGAGRKRKGAECGPNKAGAHAMRLVHSEAKMVAGDGFAVRTVDHGTVESVSDQRLTIKRRDNEVVSVTAGDDTRICRDGKEAKLSDLKQGDLAGVVQVEKEGNNSVKSIRAFSEEFVEQRKQQREQRKGERPAGKQGRPATKGGRGGEPQAR